MLEYRVEELTPALIEETVYIQDGYRDEVAGPFHSFPPDPDWKTYLAAQQRGILKVLCARGDGELKGGTFILTAPHNHYACIASSLPLLFIHPDFRRGREGIRLVQNAEEEGRKAGGQILLAHGGVHNGVYRLFEAMKYADYGRDFVKVIGDTKPVFKVR